MPEIKPKVVLLSYTKDPEKIVALAAKLCYSNADLAGLQEKIEAKDQDNFIKHLASVGHESPLEHASFTFGVEGMSRSTSHQWVRHRIAAHSQKSQRYCSEEGKNEINYVMPDSFKSNDNMKNVFIGMMKSSAHAYNLLCTELRNAGVPETSIAENARAILPNASETKIITTMNARALRHFFNVRCCGRAQDAIRHLAQEMYEQVIKVAPNLFAGTGPNCVVMGSCPEGKRSCGKMKTMLDIYSVK